MDSSDSDSDTSNLSMVTQHGTPNGQYPCYSTPALLPTPALTPVGGKSVKSERDEYEGKACMGGWNEWKGMSGTAVNNWSTIEAKGSEVSNYKADLNEECNDNCCQNCQYLENSLIDMNDVCNQFEAKNKQMMAESKTLQVSIEFKCEKKFNDKLKALKESMELKHKEVLKEKEFYEKKSAKNENELNEKIRSEEEMKKQLVEMKEKLKKKNIRIGKMMRTGVEMDNEIKDLKRKNAELRSKVAKRVKRNVDTNQTEVKAINKSLMYYKKKSEFHKEREIAFKYKSSENNRINDIKSNNMKANVEKRRRIIERADQSFERQAIVIDRVEREDKERANEESKTMIKKTPNGRYQCPKCVVTFKELGHYNRHLEVKHEIKG